MLAWMIGIAIVGLIVLAIVGACVWFASLLGWSLWAGLLVGAGALVLAYLAYFVVCVR